MSMRMLLPDGKTNEATFRDDMESLLYVVLYCSFLWLPHNLPKDKLAATIKELFEHYELHEGVQFGGGGTGGGEFSSDWYRVRLECI